MSTDVELVEAKAGFSTAACVGIVWLLGGREGDGKGDGTPLRRLADSFMLLGLFRTCLSLEREDEGS